MASVFASITLALQIQAERIQRATSNSEYQMVKQVRFDTSTQNPPSPSQLPQKFAASPPQIYSPTSAPTKVKKVLKASWVPASAANLTPTQQFEAMLDASVSEKACSYANTAQPTPTEQFEEMLEQDLEVKTRVEAQRVARWYRWW